MKRIALIALSLLLCLSLCSCSITDLFGKAGVTTGVSHTMPVTTVSAGQEDDPTALTPMDFTKVKVADYLTIDYEGLNLTTSYQIQDISDKILEYQLVDAMIYYNFYTVQSSGTTAAGEAIEASFIGYMDGVPFERGASSSSIIFLDDEFSGYIPGFANGLIGKQVGETVELQLTFPENYYEDLAGKPVTFQITILNKIITDPTDAVFNSISSGKYKTVAEYKAYLKNELEKAEKRKQFKNINDNTPIFDILDQKAVTKKYADEQVRYYYEQIVLFIQEEAKASNQSYDSMLKSMGYTEESIREEAEHYTRIDLILNYLQQEENFVFTDEMYAEAVINMAAEFNQINGTNYSPEMFEYVMAYYNGNAYLYQMAWEEALYYKVYEKAIITYDPNFGKKVDSSAVQ